MAEEFVTIEINDQPVQARKGAMLIEVADKHGVVIPRFCYHKKLSVAANCRMCLVEMEKSFKVVPACATPVNAGMKFWTRSEKAKNAQKAIMEFLLINHPLDCPICDQGGECELQDVSVGYGSTKSQYAEIKRVVQDKDIGALIETEMTRCIQCTRCVRFGDEIAGMREMGGVGRGDRLEIGTYIEKTLKSELSGNVIDLCPVGALTAKPSRYKARAWELQAHDAIAPHDCVGSHLQVHTFRKEVVRAVPRENDAINECWISDRDRFSYQGIASADRLTKPMLKRDGHWYEASWQQALEATAEILRAADPARTGALANATSTVEELYLFQRLMRGLNIRNIDHRLRQTDFSDQNAAPICPSLGMPIAQLEQQNAVFLIGSNVRQEQPLLNHRLRKAVLKGAQVMALNPRAFTFNYTVTQQAVAPVEMLQALQAIVNDPDNGVMATLKQAEHATVLLGNVANQHPDFAALRALAYRIAQQTGATFGYLVESANSVGAWVAGVVPHRLSAGRELKQPGVPVGEFLNENTRTFVLLNTELADFGNPQQAVQALTAAQNVIVIAPFADETTRQYATVLLPGSTFAETSGTFCNVAGQWQSFKGTTEPPGEARPTWKVLRVLGNSVGVPEFDWVATEEIVAELHLELDGVETCSNAYSAEGKDVLHKPFSADGFQRIGDVEMYRVDPLVRRAKALQAMMPTAEVHLNPQDAASMGIAAGDAVKVSQGAAAVTLPAQLDEGIPVGCVGVQSGLEVSNVLGAAFGSLQIAKAG
ncbi:NADH-quinone oxidoreductase subunit NuoG [Thiothrix fructosivorans]|uniref:NADH-quinone oxidoreductase n=1 Tax=Thiothrix fructosivorans TaxID=111770 RepID=A0A8B0SFW8_9GAMM|nr:NADH-quinone oxidoreductase subunit NuoG [Thiothrix fructosivorans]MBO0613598.1 NADH-quinone oxidoreductase subunit G [Thiothrix fructosivorans]QTX10983.1 NADH-quinone oxidoreductase subunit G [Thiothrix fructosivorans]